MKKKCFKWTAVSVLLTFICLACSDDKMSPAEIAAGREGVIHMRTLEDYTADNHLYMFSDNEPESVLFGATRAFNPRYPVQVSVTADQKLLLRAFSPRKIRDLRIWATIDPYPEKFLLAQFDVVPPFLEFSQRLPFADADKEYRTADGKVICLVANPHISPSDLSLEIECSDPYYKMFEAITVNWRITFSDFGKTGYWKWPLKPGECREAVAMSLNSAYMFSSQEYEDLMREYNGKFYANGAAPNNGPLIEDNQVLINLSRSHNGGIKWGHVAGVGGLGGGNVIGLTEASFVGHYADDTGECMAWFHEFGHGMGYGDSNNTVISNDGGNTVSWRKVCQGLYRKMCVEKKLPVYSRRFMHSRRNYALYSSRDVNFRYRPSSVIIEDPELDEIDGGLTAGKDFLATDLNDSGAELSFKLDYQAAEVAQKDFQPYAVHVYGDEMYVVNNVRAQDNSLDVYDLSTGKPVLKKRIREWTNPADGKQIAIGSPADVFRSNGKIYLAGVQNSVYAFDARSYECVGAVGLSKNPVGLATSNGTLYAFRDVVRAFPEHQIPPTLPATPCLAATPDLNSHSSNSLAMDHQGNVYAVSYHTKKMVRLNPRYLMAGKLTTENERTFDANPLGAAWSKDGRLFVTFGGTDRKFCEVDPASGKVIKDYTTVGGITLRNPLRCIIRRNTLFIVERNPESCVYAIPLNKLD